MKDGLIRVAIQAGAIYLGYICYDSYRNEQRVKEANDIRDKHMKYGGNYPLSEEKQKVVDGAANYLQNHAGLRYLNRVRTREQIEERMRKLLDEKQKQLEKMSNSEGGEEKKLLEEEVKQLNLAYQNTKLKVTSLQDIAEPDIEDDKSKYYEKV